MAQAVSGKKNPSVDGYLRKNKQWQPELQRLREIILSCGLAEDMKWREPCYTLDGKNVVLIHGFKEYCALMFFKGVLMKDDKSILIQQTENVQSTRQIRFTNVQEIIKMEPILKSYIEQAIEIEKAGLKVELKKTSEFKMPAEFKKKLSENPAFKTAFKSLTPGRQRGYLLHFSGAKQSQTREARIEKCMQRIMEGKGLND